MRRELQEKDSKKTANYRKNTTIYHSLTDISEDNFGSYLTIKGINNASQLIKIHKSNILKDKRDSYLSQIFSNNNFNNIAVSINTILSQTKKLSTIEPEKIKAKK